MSSWEIMFSIIRQHIYFETGPMTLKYPEIVWADDKTLHYPNWRLPWDKANGEAKLFYTGIVNLWNLISLLTLAKTYVQLCSICVYFYLYIYLFNTWILRTHNVMKCVSYDMNSLQCCHDWPPINWASVPEEWTFCIQYDKYGNFTFR